MNSENSKKSEPYRLFLNISDKRNLKRSDECVALSNLSIFYTCKNIKKSYKINKFKISAPTWYENLELPDGSYSVSDIQDYFSYIIKKHQKVTDNPPIRIYVKKTENRLTFKIKTVYFLEIFVSKTMKH